VTHALRWLSIACVCVLGIAWPSFALAQDDRASVVVEVRSAGEPLPGAAVTAAGTTVVTGRDGGALMAVAPGTVEVAVSKDGYLPALTRLTVNAGERRDLEIELRRLEETVVVSARSSTRLEDQPLRVEVIDREEIEEKAMMTPGNVAMLVSETTGLRVQTTAPSLGAANVRIQGLRGRYSQLLADGLPLYGTQGDSLSLLQVPPLDLGRVEVIKGVASALYGTSALGGVVNLVSRRPRADERQLLVNATSQTGRDVAGWYSHASTVTPWSWTLLGSYSGQTQRDLDGDGWSDVPTFDRAVVRPRLFFDNGQGRTMFATLGVTTEDREGGTLPLRTAPDGRPFRESLATRHVDGGFSGSWLVTGGRLVSVRASALTQVQQRQTGDVTEHGTHAVWFGEASVHGVNGAHTWVLGGAFQQDRFSLDELPQFDYRFSSPAVFGQDEIAFGRKWTLGISTRVDAHSEYGTLASPRVSLLVRPSVGWTVRLAGGTGAFAPTPFTEETEETGLSRVLPLRGLKAERAASTSLDVTRVLGPLDVTATVFASVVHDPLQQQIVDAGHVELVNASGPTRTTGTELLARFRAGEFTALVTHGWTRSTEIDPDDGVRHDVPLTPRHTASFTVIWEAEGAGRLGFEGYYTGRQSLDDNPYRATGRPYFLIGALAEKRIGRLRLFINAENLLDMRQTREDPLVLPARRPDGRWTVDAWAPLDGRVVNGGIRVIF
jgi:outer membrane receptor for ferrienterochelin and colicins